MSTAFKVIYTLLWIIGEFDCKVKINFQQGKRNTAPPRPSEKQATLLEKSSEVTSPVTEASGSRDENKLSKHQIQKAREKAKREAKVRINLLIFIHKYLRQFCNSVWWKARHLDVLMVDNDQLELVITGCFLIHLEAYYVLGPLSHGHNPAGVKRQF